MKGNVQRSNTKSLLRDALIVFQFTISLTLIICTLVVGNQIHYMMNKDLGFNNKDAIINIRIRNIKGNRDVLVNKIKQFSYVDMVSVHTAPPAALFHNGTRFIYNVNGEEQVINGGIEFCDENFIPLYGLRMIAGRNLLPSPYMKEYVINETFARQLGFNNPQDAIGQYMVGGQTDRIPDDPDPASNRRPIQIVGVVSDYHLMPLYEQISPIAISASSGHQELRTLSVKVSIAGNMKQIVADMERTWKELNPYERFEMTFYDEAIAAFYEKEHNTAQIINAAMLMAIFISCMGLFGLVVFTTKQRTKEIGIRKVLGASTYQILTLFSNRFVKLIIISMLIASPVAWFLMDKWLSGFAYHVPVRWWIFVLAFLSALLIAVATISVQTVKVARMNPVDSIKSE